MGRFEDESWRLRKDGTRFWANVVISAIFDAAGVLKGFAKVTRDLTEKRRVAALETEGRRIQEFLALLGHELRNPLAPIWRRWTRAPATGRPPPPRLVHAPRRDAGTRFRGASGQAGGRGSAGAQAKAAGPCGVGDAGCRQRLSHRASAVRVHRRQN
ncbi:PAS domain S-box protein [uncultured Pseudacidovorax sp.]|uniref:PAS domain S-box protein n=1 Tax=uncultured Pseudacidovorax sp. TaxID=679313 RepID=UPI00344CC17A